LCFALSAFAWVPPAKLNIIQQEGADKQLVLIRGIGTVLLVSPWILDFSMFFPDLDFRIRFDSLGCDQFQQDLDRFLRTI